MSPSQSSTAAASITNWVALSQWNYTATVTPTASGDVSISVPTDVATDDAGNPNTASTTHTVTVDLSNPTATVSVPSGTQAATFDATITFSKPVTGFLADDLLISGTATATVTNVVAARGWYDIYRNVHCHNKWNRGILYSCQCRN